MIETRQAITPVDPVWDRITREAEEAVATQPLMGGLIHACILHHKSLEKALSYRDLGQAVLERDVDDGAARDRR